MDFASNEQEIWNALRTRAAGRLPDDFPAGVLRAAGRERRRRQVRRVAFGVAAAVLCLAYGTMTFAHAETDRKREALWMQYKQGQWLTFSTL